ncbi:winged helix-turn-helix domain-containing protein [Thaumasiovibrio subtropicus]|uniref:winged helix-turn-helix domain-containing protein n=1 Tax=Thaumasiovibrio subtropicus TaxID=1891207 RepID=UPI000B3628DF|nr:crosslink repair DNA glycosylase YcaQ family protein [Thaumasiovibrio subtropicus]
MLSLSLHQARKLALLSQGLLSSLPKGAALDKAHAVIAQLSYVQIDTISVVQRAHHHVFWSRSPSYKPQHLNQLVASKRVFEYWAHAAAYLPMSDYRYSLPRKHALKTGQQQHWYKKNPALMAEVYQRIKDEGPLMAKDFESERKTVQGWGSKPTKQALESLFMQGDLMISERRQFHKVYDLTERVLPAEINTRLPTPLEYGEYLVLRYLKAHGIGQLGQFCYLLKDVKTPVSDAVRSLLDKAKICEVTVEGENYYASCDALARLGSRLNRKRAKILSPFDNLLIQRKRALALFDFDYQIECYVPAAKRQFGYFSLPVLWDGRLVARADCKVDKKAATLNLIHLCIEPHVKQADFLDALHLELDAFAHFNHCDTVNIQRISVR